MKKILLSCCLLMGGYMSAFSENYAVQLTQQTAVETKNAYKGMFNVITYNEEGNILHSGNGFFTDDKGTGIAAFSIFENAHKAVIVDYKGNKLAVHRILGANSNYDLVKFSTTGAKKIESFNISNNPETAVGTNLNLILYTGKKKAQPQNVSIEKSDDFQEHKYLTISASNEEKNMGCPLTDNEGNVVAIVQKNVEENASQACAIDGRFVHELQISSTSLLNADLNAIHITKGLPLNEKDALTYIYMLGNKDSLAAINALNDFIETYPDNAEGYTNRGTFHAQYGHFELCEKDFTTALEKADNEVSTIKPDGIHNNFSKVIYNEVINSGKNSKSLWTMQKAIDEAAEAFNIKPSPYYLLQQGHCYFAEKEYEKAYQNYVRINTHDFPQGGEWSPQAKAETWLYAARAYEMDMHKDGKKATLQDSLKVISLIDSTIAALPKPYILADSKLFFERAQRHEMVKQYRKAVMDYYEYEKLIGPKNLNDKFYYLREQAELKCHMYQQALDDIRTAIAFNPKDPFYPVEEAVILLQAGMFKEAITACQKSLETIPENPDCYKIMGIAYGELKNKKEALKHLQKAQDLGDPTIEAFIEKYK